MPNAMSKLPPRSFDVTVRSQLPMLPSRTKPCAWKLALSDIDRLMRRSLPTTCVDNPFVLSVVPTLQPGLQPFAFVLQYFRPVNAPNVLKPACPCGTQNPPPSAELIAPGKIEVSFEKPPGVMRTCAPPSIV